MPLLIAGTPSPVLHGQRPRPMRRVSRGACETLHCHHVRRPPPYRRVGLPRSLLLCSRGVTPGRRFDKRRPGVYACSMVTMDTTEAQRLYTNPRPHPRMSDPIRRRNKSGRSHRQLPGMRQPHSLCRDLLLHNCHIAAPHTTEAQRLHMKPRPHPRNANPIRCCHNKTRRSHRQLPGMWQPHSLCRDLLLNNRHSLPSHRLSAPVWEYGARIDLRYRRSTPQ